MAKIFNWGMFPKVDAEILETDNYERISEFIKTSDVLIPRGKGRCYGDSSLQKTIFSTLALDKFISFDKQNCTIKCEAGVLLSDILKVVVPHGFFLPVTPGTRFITIGGAVASNIHGKNHHKEGAISKYIKDIEILTESGEILHCSRNENKDLFTNTIGGMGLTGIILTVSISLKRIETSFVSLKSIKATNLSEVLDLFDQYNNYTYSVAWIDCLSNGAKLGRSILMLGEHSELDQLNSHQLKKPLGIHTDKQLNVPHMFPGFTLNSLSIKAFNFLYYHKQLRKEENKIVPYSSFFFPLDKINNWNRIYGKKGFIQYQFVIPFENGRERLEKILVKIAKSGLGSFLAVLKTFGEGDEFSAPISFPRSGYTLALDFKLTTKVMELLDELDEMVLNLNGRLYLTKDARMAKTTFKDMYKKPFSHPPKFGSLQSNRIGL
jgi:decaprenylphospho-beta-D-ribofuranose 2-oxidase